jgi:hypothetical protein
MANSPSLIIQFPTQIQTTSALDTSTGPVTYWDTSDALSLSFTVLSATTAPGAFVEVAYTTNATGPFFKLSYPSLPSSSAALVVPTSSFIAVISPVTFKQLRFGTTAVITAAGQYTGGKAVTI